jgi:hypothetical protein
LKDAPEGRVPVE